MSGWQVCHEHIRIHDAIIVIGIVDVMHIVIMFERIISSPSSVLHCRPNFIKKGTGIKSVSSFVGLIRLVK